MSWISVNEKQPDTLQTVLLYMPYLYGLVIGELSFYNNEKNEEILYWLIRVESRYIDHESSVETYFKSNVKFEEVTHWMPITEPEN